MQFNLFLIITPGLEDLAQKEVELKCPVPELRAIKGGLELSADLDWIIKAHSLLKIPTRILMRLAEFKVRDFPKLHQKFIHFKWNDFLSHPDPVFEISCAKSRLMHTDRIEDTIQDALKEALIRQPLSRDWEKKNYLPQTFYVRIVDDVLTLSLDLSGEALYKRGQQVIKGEAPIRENLAAAFVMLLMEGVIGPVTLVDPMCGSGTLLTEALSFHLPLHLRPYAFETAPFFKGKLFKSPPPFTAFPIQNAKGFDLNQELINKIKTNLPIEFKVQDSISTPIHSENKMLMICNPPYGQRIKIDGKRGSFLKNAWDKFLTTDRPWRFAWVLPSDMDDLFKNPEGYILKNKRHLKNGGLAVTFWIWEKKD
jgi:putative N6-adenine-specific DNA methylase